NNLFEKIYIALVQGSVKPPSGTLEHWLIHSEKQAVVSHRDHKEAKKCCLAYEVLEEVAGNSLVRVMLKTGRYHQIRAQFSAISHPVVGDSKYGSSVSFKKNAIALHHAELSFPHPVTKERITVLAPHPAW
ncbi:MAG: RNA pseudouridine synthase, partial [Verrucomicrobia bacterium]|nr:RNA pseudouridine synthase [Verrucomicrobiota bacterium]